MALSRKEAVWNFKSAVCVLCVCVGGVLTRAVSQEAIFHLLWFSRAVSSSPGRGGVVTRPHSCLCAIVTTGAAVSPLCPCAPSSMSCRGERGEERDR